MVEGGSSSAPESKFKLDRLAPWAVFVASFALLAANTAPGVSFHDSGEFSLAIQSAGIPHPPGAPTWVIAGLILKSLLPALTGAKIANLLSALMGAAAMALSYKLILRLASNNSTPEAEKGKYAVAALAPLTLLGVGAFLEQSFAAEQYTLLLAILFGIVHLALDAVDPDSFGPISSRTGIWKPFVGIGLLWGLAVGNHPSQVVLGLLAIYVVFAARKKFAWWKGMLAGAAGLVGGVSVFAYLPIRSAQNPVLDWGNPETVDRMMWSLQRKQWKGRSISEAPVGMVKAWFESYDLMGQVGLVAIVVGAVGLYLVGKNKKPLAWILSLAVSPYSAVLLVGHLSQELMDLPYIKYYGVIDWHLPIYAAFAIGVGAVGVALMQNKEKPLWPLIGVLAILGLVRAGQQIGEQSLKDFAFPATFAKMHFDAAPTNAILVNSSDNGAQIAAYLRYGENIRQDLYVAFGMPHTALTQPGEQWSQSTKLSYVKGALRDPNQQPLNLPALSDEEILKRPFVGEYFSGAPRTAATLLPSGILFEYRDMPTSEEEIRAAEAVNRAAHPEVLEGPKGKQHRLVKEAMAAVHLRRAMFFYHRKVLDLAVDSAKLALEWHPDHAPAWFTLGGILDEMKQYDLAEQAYLDAIQRMPDLPGPRQNLAYLYGLAKNFDRAEELAEQEMRLTRGSKNTKALLDVLAQMKAKG